MGYVPLEFSSTCRRKFDGSYEVKLSGDQIFRSRLFDHFEYHISREIRPSTPSWASTTSLRFLRASAEQAHSTPLDLLRIPTGQTMDHPDDRRRPISREPTAKKDVLRPPRRPKVSSVTHAIAPLILGLYHQPLKSPIILITLGWYPNGNLGWVGPVGHMLSRGRGRVPAFRVL